MKRFALVSLLLAACATSPGGANSTTASERRVTDISMGVQGSNPGIRIESSAVLDTRSRVFTEPPSRVWQVAPLAYQDLGVALAAYDSTQMYLGNPGLAVRRRLGTAPISRYLTCGTAGLGISVADTYAVRLSVVSRVRPTAEGAVLETQVRGDATQPNVSGGPVECTSTGLLEEALGRAVALRLANVAPR